MKLTQTQLGELAILTESLLSSLLPIISLITFTSLSPLFTLAGSLIFTAIFFFIIITYKNRWQELIRVDVLKDIAWVVIFIGIFYYGLFFFGLQFTNAGNAGIILQMELFFTFLFFNIFKKEDITKEHLLGATLMLLSTLIIFSPQLKTLNFNKGDLLILLATAFPPVGNFFQRKLRQKVSGESIIFLRTIFALPFIFLLAYLFKTHTETVINYKTILFLLLNGVVILGVTKILWLEAIIRISVTKANALASVRPFITLVLTYLILKQTPSSWQLLSVFPMLLGIYFLTKSPNQKTAVEDV